MSFYGESAENVYNADGKIRHNLDLHFQPRRPMGSTGGKDGMKFSQAKSVRAKIYKMSETIETSTREIFVPS